MRTNRPIKSCLKGERLVQREAIDATSWAYMKMLREQDRTKKVYPVDPYVEVYQFRDNLYGLLTESADGMGDPWMYLLIGPEKAMLVDTGFGIGDLKGLVRELTGGMPLIVANTHCHFDHAYGNCQFERCYCHELEVEAMERKQDPTIWDYLFTPEGQGVWFDFPRADIVPWNRYEVVGVPDGHIFDLGGGYEVELLWLPGHAAGHATFLDKPNRVLLSGDGIISMRVGVGSGGLAVNSVSSYRNELVKLSKRLGEFDHIYSGHFVGDLENSVVLGLIAACDAIIANPAGADDRYQMFNREALLKYVQGLGTIGYSVSAI
jgi:glyoxylase-like metal-dependent hydrolase (beta-lactamase superfamily II)